VLLKKVVSWLKRGQ
jgi:hypothetical protein